MGPKKNINNHEFQDNENSHQINSEMKQDIFNGQEFENTLN